MHTVGKGGVWNSTPQGNFQKKLVNENAIKPLKGIPSTKKNLQTKYTLSGVFKLSSSMSIPRLLLFIYQM